VIDEMTLAEAGEVFRYWEENPPAHLMVQTIARLLGWQPRRPNKMPTSLAEIAASAPPGLAVARGGDPSLPAPVFDPDELRARNWARAMKVARRGGVA
jgi:hypothetical protein